MTCTSKGIFGKLVDDQGRCIHYNSSLDVIANRCGICGKLYACYKCHNELEAHSFGSVLPDEKDTVMCGVCGSLFSYRTYSTLSSCPTCSSRFNPNCALHKSCYARAATEN
ncbi:MAG: hypothetical protein K6G80_09850 [Treponema sp.]|nr:hypothetical protein [Treponema sp.]